MTAFKLSPSDFSFLWEECKCCFYLKVAGGYPRPRMPFPKIFAIIDGQMNTCYSGMRTEDICPDLPAGIVRLGQKWVRSRPIEVAGQNASCYILGRFDTAVEFDDGTYGVIDFKTSSVGEGHITLYSRQLHAYAYALENPAPGNLTLSPITRLGLLVFEPSSFVHEPDQTAHLAGTVKWVPMERDDAAFLEFLGQIVSVLAQPMPPEPAADCTWCQYRAASQKRLAPTQVERLHVVGSVVSLE